MSLLTELLNSIVELPGKFAAVATHDPVAGVMLAVGAIITLLSVAVFGLLTLGAVADLFTTDRTRQRRPAR